MRKIFLTTFTLLVTVLLTSNAHALTPIFGSTGLNLLGAFEGTFDFSNTDDSNAEINISLKNTSPGGNGKITAFVFNNPSNLITGASLQAGTNFGLLGGPAFDNGVNAASHGQFDFGLSTGGGYTGGGSPNNGIFIGDTETFKLFLTGSGFNGLNDNSFLSELSVPPGDGSGLESFVVRFRGFDPDGSDKVPNDCCGNNLVPEPTTMLLFGSGMVGTILRRRKK